MKSAHVTFQTEEEVLGELKAVDLSDDEEEPMEGGKGQDCNDGSGGQPPGGPTKSKRSSPGSGLPTSSRLAQRRRASNAQLSFESTDDSSDNHNFLAALLENENEDAFCKMGLVGEIATEPGGPSTVGEAMNKELQGLREKGSFKDITLPTGTEPVKTRCVFEIKQRLMKRLRDTRRDMWPEALHNVPGKTSSRRLDPSLASHLLRTVLATTAQEEWSLRALNFKQAYRNATLSGNVWLEFPDGSVIKAANATYGL